MKKRRLIIFVFFSVNLCAMEEPLEKKLVERNKKFIKKVEDEKTFYYTLKKLLEKNADPNAVGEQGITPLYHLTTQKKLSLKKIKLLLEHKADCNKESLVFVQRPNRDRVKYEKTYIKESPLGRLLERFYQRRFKNNIAVIKLLLEHNASPHAVGVQGCLLMHTLMRTCDIEEDKDTKNFITFIIDHKGDINGQEDEMGYTPFSLLFFHRDVKTETIRFFLEHHADPNIIDKILETPFFRSFNHYCSATEVNYDILNLFAQHNADFKAIAKKALRLKSIEAENFKLLRYLAAQGVDFVHDPLLIKEVFKGNIRNPNLMSFFLECNMDPTITLCGRFLFRYGWNQEARIMFLEAIPPYIKRQYVIPYTALLLCLKAKQKGEGKEYSAYKLPSPLKRLLFEMVCTKLKPFLSTLDTLKEKSHKVFFSSEDERMIEDAIIQLCDGKIVHLS